ncbi:MAG: lipopolysaccharide biosynthesis protein [Coriobacteriales bacterium]|jgi:O-antigen/teichoic acid export membrane protein|nr:lipopolysaccharide biosynthesis protein [Coriobacteriales bacterium]
MTSQRSAYLWNAASGGLSAFQSVIMLVVITHVCNIVVAGVFTIAFTLANQLLNIGKFGMRNFQVSDVPPECRFSFGDYAASRVVTTGLMLVAAAVYIAISAQTLAYSGEKTMVMLLMCLLKAVDSVEDVFFGNFQQHQHLDVAGKLMFIRCAVMIAAFCGALVISQSLAAATLWAVLLSVVTSGSLLAWAWRCFRLPAGNLGFSWPEVWRLLRECTPLFLAAFLLLYIGFAPRFAIDALAGDTAQAVYGFISMPVFIVSLLASLLYNPLVATLSRLWSEGRRPEFARAFARQTLWTALITLGCTLAAFLLGAPVLSLLFGTDLELYIPELCILVCGGGFFALASLFGVGATILRRQKLLLAAYAVTSAVAFVAAPLAVEHWGVTGAAWCYLGCMALLAGLVFACFFWCLREKR